nr:putative reverse transcriptase domain-containing protein [Tanacetum cinerariifolium]
MVESVVHPFVGTKLEELKILGPELIQETTEKIVQIKQRMQAARDRQKSYADLKRELMEFQNGDKVMLKVSPWKGVVRFGKRRKLNPKYIGTFKVLGVIGNVSYKLDLPEELIRVHNTFHVSNLKKCHADEPLAETMKTVNQGMSVEEIERVVAQRVANAIEAIAIYETKTNLAHKSMSQTERQEEEVAENVSNKRKWESNHNGSLSQQNKGHKVPRAHTAWPINKKAYAGPLPLRNQCKSHHSGQCTVKYKNCKEVGHITQDCRTPATAKNQRTRTCYEYRSLRHYKSKCPMVKFHKRMDMIHEG